MDFRGDQIVEFAYAAHFFQLAQADREGVRVGLQLTRRVGLQQVEQVALIDAGKAFVHVVAALLQHERGGDDDGGIQRDAFPFFS